MRTLRAAFPARGERGCIPVAGDDRFKEGRVQETIFMPDVVEVHKTVDVLFKLRSND